MDKWLRQITLEGAFVKLEPLERKHNHALMNAAADGNLWDLWYTAIPTHETVDAYIDKALTEYEEDKSLPFVVIDKQTDRIVGTTRYMNATPVHKRLEIGSTWYAKSAQRTGINTACKYLLLKYAFEELHCIAVEFRTHWHNTPSRNAIARLGAKQDGVLRSHQIGPDGTLRDTVVFSITQSEWSVTKMGLEFKMRKNS